MHTHFTNELFIAIELLLQFLDHAGEGEVLEFLFLGPGQFLLLPLDELLVVDDLGVALGVRLGLGLALCLGLRLPEALFCCRES